MKKVSIIIALAIAALINTGLQANAIMITNATSDKIKVGLYASLFNFSVMTFNAGETREYDSGTAQECVQKITINGTEVWTGTNCENYTLSIQKNNDGSYGLTFGASNKLLAAPVNPEQGLNM